MAKQVVTIEGFEAVRKAVRLVPDEARAVLADVVQKTAFAAKQRAMAMAPRASGHLRAALASSSRGLHGRVTVAPTAFYWKFVEYGTKRMPARPFVRPAAELEERDFITRIRQAGERLERDFSTGSRFL